MSATCSKEQSQSKKKANQLYTGKWHNQHNSEIDLSADAEGQITGVFRAGSTSGQEISMPEEFPLTGFVAGDVIAFCVQFEEFDCITAWVGHLTEVPGTSERLLVTVWHMSVHVGKQGKGLIWKSIVTGADNFVSGQRQSNTSSLKSTASFPCWKSE